MTIETVSSYNKRDDGTLETNKLPKQHLLMIKEMDFLTGIGRLSGYLKSYKLSGDWIRNEKSTTYETTTKTLRNHQLKRKRERFLGHVVFQEQMLVGLTDVDTNLQWERPKDMIKLYSFY